MNAFTNVGSGRTFTVNGTLYCGTNWVTGAGNFTLATGSTLGLADPYGITASTTGATGGNIQVTGTRTYIPGSPYASFIYNASGAHRLLEHL